MDGLETYITLEKAAQNIDVVETLRELAQLNLQTLFVLENPTASGGLLKIFTDLSQLKDSFQSASAHYWERFQEPRFTLAVDGINALGEKYYDKVVRHIPRNFEISDLAGLLAVDLKERGKARICSAETRNIESYRYVDGIELTPFGYDSAVGKIFMSCLPNTRKAKVTVKLKARCEDITEEVVNELRAAKGKLVPIGYEVNRKKTHKTFISGLRQQTATYLNT